MVANNRRLAWTELTMVVIFFFLITPLRRVKRFLIRALVISVVPLLIYGAVGWSSQGGRLFAPVRTVRSLFDADVDASTRWRDWENYDLVSTYAQNPVFGSGSDIRSTRSSSCPTVTRDLRARALHPAQQRAGAVGVRRLDRIRLALGRLPGRNVFSPSGRTGWSRTPTERITALGAAAVQILLRDAGLRRSRLRHLGPGLHRGDGVRAACGKDLRRQRRLAGADVGCQAPRAAARPHSRHSAPSYSPVPASTTGTYAG